MSMEGRRFGVGLVAGLLVALAVVALAGGAERYGPAASPTAFTGGLSNSVATTSTTTGAIALTVTETATGAVTTYQSMTTAAATVTSTASMTVTTYGGATNSTASNSTNTLTMTSIASVFSTFSPPSTSSSTSSTWSNSFTYPSGEYINSAPSANQPALSSRIDNIASQPAISNAVIIVPILVAFLLGAVLYRVSMREKSAG